jgi:capsular polysaccharide biosynthesis protein
MLTNDATVAGRSWRRLRRLGRSATARVSHKRGDPRAHASAGAGGGRLRHAAAEMVGNAGDRRIVVLADPACRDSVAGWLHDFSRDHVSLLLVGGAPDLDLGSGEARTSTTVVRVADLDDVVAHLIRMNAQDLIVVVLGSTALVSVAKDHRMLFARLFLHLRRGGAYVVDRTVEGVGTSEGPTDAVEGRFLRLLAAGLSHDDEVRLGRRALGIEDQVKGVLVTEDLVVVTKLGRNPLKLRENKDVVDLLEAREPGIDVSVLETRPAGQLTPTMHEASYGPSHADPWPATLEYPEMTVRHYEGSLVSRGSMRLYAGNTILPESFRWPRAKHPSHPRMRSVTPLFARLDRPNPTRALHGDFYYLDCVFPSHFGHLTTEVLCRLWGWERAKREIPGLKVLFHTNIAHGRDGSLERRLFTAYGIPESDLRWSDRPVRLRSVVAASPMWHNHEPYYAHPDLRDTWARMTTGLLAGAEPSPHERIFVSRGAGLSNRRGCRNQEEVESFFASRGYHVFYPEQLPLAEQVALFAGARVVAGFAGSAMANLMHCQRLEAVVAISHNAYVARNEHLFASLLGAQLHYFWQAADVETPRGVKRSKASDRSSFAFDFASQGDDLGRVLAGL